ncbi:phosphatase and actin regulator 2 [Trichonephila clavipes]|nr:phosphatase and actin regulator 2 [Trichonephila clavipes]
MYKNALKEDLIRVVQELDGIVESTDTIVKLKTKIENSSTFESDPDFVKTLIQNCIDERVSQNEREETATHIGIREAEDWFRPIDLAKECDIYISSRSGSHKEIPITYGYTQDPFKNKSQNFKTKIKENYPQYHERENKNCYICGDSSHCARDCEKRFKPKESNDHIHNKINVNTLKRESEKQNSDECANLQYYCVRKPNGAMKTSSVEFISQSPTPSPMNSNYRRFVLLRKIFEPWQWKRRKKRNRFKQTSRTLQRKISMRSTKDQLIKKVVLMPVKHNVFLWNLPDVEEMPSHDGETV